MRKDEFYYKLPKELIAQHPIEFREMSKLLYINGNTGDMGHYKFNEITKFLNAGDCLVLNNTKVIPARLLGYRKDTQTPVEVLLLKQVEKDIWEVIVRPGKRMRRGHQVVFVKDVLEGEIIDVKEDGNRLISFQYSGIWEEVLDKIGKVPLPPYIHEKLIDKSRYQTVYAKHDGSAAAPTAGLHFTSKILTEIRDMSVTIAEITLHVGLGTFRPVKETEIENHIMHSESYEIKSEAAGVIRQTIQHGGRIIGVGTTSCRVLESVMQKYGEICPCSGETSIFIYPGYTFKVLDVLITNFHLPESTLLMLVSAFAGTENIRRAYEEAIREKYRFFSFGDAMFLTRKTTKEINLP